MEIIPSIIIPANRLFVAAHSISPAITSSMVKGVLIVASNVF
jgi:hypothetical protein